VSNSLDWIDFEKKQSSDTVHKGGAVGKVPCHCCGQPMLVKFNKNLIAYAFCNAYGNDNPCGSSYKWSRKHSDEIRRRFSALKGANDNANATTTTTATKDNATINTRPTDAAQTDTERHHRDPEPDDDDTGTGLGF
jgi:hypothetical protein